MEGGPRRISCSGAWPRRFASEQEVVENQPRRNDVDGALGREATSSMPHTIGVRQDRGEERYTAEFILIAVGTFPAAPPGVPVDGQIVLTSDAIVA